MDHTRVPGGAPALRRLQETHRDVHLSYDAALQIYTLYGAYSKVQAALAQLFDQPGNQQSDAVERATSGSWSERLSQNLQVTASEDLRANPRERRPADPLRSPAEVPSSSSQRDLTPGAYGVEDTGQRQGTSPQPAWSPEEDDFLIVDADMFQYLQKYCQNDYQQILRLYGVEAVEVTNQGLTSLYLQSAGGAGENVRDQTTLSLARNAISQFFQTLETKMWRAEFTKSIFSSGKLLQMAKDNLSLRYPTILLKEDDTTIYMIGNRKDVCDAKQFFLDQSLYLCLKSEEDETKDDVVRRCRLAPRFKESGLPPLGGRATDFCLRGGATAASRPKCSGPMLGFNVLPETAQIGERVPGASAQTAAKDILSMSQSSWSPAASTQTNDASFDSGFFKSQPKEAPPSTSQQDPALVPAGPGSTRKRASSFSGTPQRKAQLTPQQSQDDASKSAAGARASSSGPTDQAGRCRQAVYNAEILVSSLVWQHIKDAYSTQVDDLTSGIQTRESFRGDSSIVAVSLRGTSPSQLKSARLSLQELIDSVIPGFSVQKLPLSELGLTDPADETLLACCHDVRSCFPKVTIQITKKNVLVLGPERSCSQVAASLLSVFSKDLRAVIKQQECSIPSTSTSGPAPLVQSAEPEPESSRGSTGAPGSDDERRTKQSSYGETAQGNGCVSQPRLHKEPVIKDKVRGPGNRNGQQSGLFVSKMVDERGNETKSGTRPGEVASRSVKERLDSSQKDTAQQRCKQREESRCSAEAEPLRWGILGRMTFSRLNISIPGHKNNSTLKISYIIPDGIQQVRSWLRLQSFYRFSLHILNRSRVLPGRPPVSRKAVSRGRV